MSAKNYEEEKGVNALLFKLWFTNWHWFSMSWLPVYDKEKYRKWKYMLVKYHCKLIIFYLMKLITTN